MKHRFVIRKIRQGRVKIAKQWYIPSSQWLKYDGRFDGQRFVFGRYENLNTVCLWGSERDFKNQDEDFESDNFTVVDGSLPWYWWHNQKSEPATPV